MSHWYENDDWNDGDHWETHPSKEEVIVHENNVANMWYAAWGLSYAWMVSLGALIYTWYPYMIATNTWWKT